MNCCKSNHVKGVSSFFESNIVLSLLFDPKETKNCSEWGHEKVKVGGEVGLVMMKGKKKKKKKERELSDENLESQKTRCVRMASPVFCLFLCFCLYLLVCAILWTLLPIGWWVILRKFQTYMCTVFGPSPLLPLVFQSSLLSFLISNRFKCYIIEIQYIILHKIYRNFNLSTQMIH